MFLYTGAPMQQNQLFISPKVRRALGQSFVKARKTTVPIEVVKSAGMLMMAPLAATATIKPVLMLVFMVLLLRSDWSFLKFMINNRCSWG